MEHLDKGIGTVRNGYGKNYWLLAIKICVFLFMMIAFTALFSLLLKFLSNLYPALFSGIVFNTIAEFGMLIGSVFSAFLILKFWEHLPFSDIGLRLKGHWGDFLWGTFVALLLYAIGFSVLILIGEIKVLYIQFDLGHLLQMWLFMLVVAATEEIMVRGFVLGRLLNAGINRFVALFLSAFLFSLMHVFNPNFAFLPFLNILLAGILLGATYIYTRNLWFPISLHLFWNWLQGPILGFEVSGGDMGATCFTLELPQNTIINGGTFGFEGSIVCTVLMILVTGLILWLQEHKKQMITGV